MYKHLVKENCNKTQKYDNFYCRSHTFDACRHMNCAFIPESQQMSLMQHLTHISISDIINLIWYRQKYPHKPLHIKCQQKLLRLSLI